MPDDPTPATDAPGRILSLDERAALYNGGAGLDYADFAAPLSATPATDWTPLPDTEPERTIATLQGDVAHALARERRALDALRDARAVLARLPGLCGHPDAAQACRNVLDVLRAYRERGEVPDPWTRVTEDDASLPPAGETVLVWTAHGPTLAWWGQDVVGNPAERWDHDNWHAPQDRDHVLAWQRVAGRCRWLGRTDDAKETHMVDMHVQRAYDGEKFIGYRLSIPGQTGVLVWADQAILEGFRSGDSFVPSPGKPIHYVPCELVELTEPPAGEVVNRCEGCRRGLPVDRHGIHGGGGSADGVMFCTADRYAHKP